MNAMLTQARSAPGMVLRAELLDADPYALCTPAGIVDLHTGLIRTPQPDKDFHSRSTSTGPKSQPTPRWDRFLADTFGDDAEGREMIDFLHLMLGYSITGDVGAQVMPFLFGSGKNGKSVLLDVLMKLLGDYADASSGTFRRRVFWLLPHDRGTAPDGLYASGAPAEAVDPITLAAGSRGRKTERSERPAQAADA